MSSSASKNIRIEVISDNVCPWCFVGKRKMEKAIKQKSDVHFDVTWKPFYLNPEMGPEGENLREHLINKYGEAMVKRFDAPSNPLSNAGRSVGITFNPDRRVVNTRDSHRLVDWAKKFGKQNDMIEALFHAYFEQGNDISKLDVLGALAKEAGLDENAARAYLQSDENKKEIDSECRSYRGINGVPHFTISIDGVPRKLQLSGAQDAETFLEAFEMLLMLHADSARQKSAPS